MNIENQNTFREPDLFPVYPNVPAARATDTSRQAADSVAGSAGDIRDQVLRAIREAGHKGLTADEAAGKLDLSILTIRPRCSELRKMALIEDSNEQRKNNSGRNAIVWIAVSDITQ